MFSVRFGKQREKYVAIVDIDGASAGVAIAAIRRNSPAEIIAAERYTMSVEQQNLEQVAGALGNGLSETAQKVAKLVGRPVQRVYAIIRAPWSSSRALKAAAKYKENIRFDEAHIKELAKEALQSASGIDINKLLEASVTRVEINGYPTTHPEGKSGHVIEVSALASTWDENLRLSIKNVLFRTFSITPIMRSGIRTLLSFLSKGPKVHSDYLLIVIGDEATALTVVRWGVLAEYIQVSEGTRSIVSRIGGTALPQETLSLIRMLESDQCEAGACDEIKASIAKAEGDLVRIYGEAMGKLIAKRKLPNGIMLVAHKDLAPWLKQFFSRIDFTQFTATARPLVVESITDDALSPFVISSHGVNTDLGLSIGAALVNIEMQV